MQEDSKLSGGPPALHPAQVLPPEIPGASPANSQGWTTAYFEPVEAAGGQERAGDLFEYLALVLSRKYTVLSITLLGGLVAWAISTVQTPLYRARTAIEIQSMTETDALYRIIDKDWRGGGVGSAVTPESYLETQLHILTSRTFQVRVQDKIRSAPRAESHYEFNRPRRLLSMVGLKLPSPVAAGLPPVRCDSTTVENTRIVHISCQSPDPEYAADYVNTIAREFIAYNLEVQTETAERTMKWLTNQLADLRNKVDLARSRLENYSAASGVRFEAEQPDTEKSDLKDLQKELASTRVQRITDQTAYEVALAANRDRESIDDRLATYQDQLLKLKNQLEQLSQRYTADHPQVRQIRSEIETLEKIMARQTSTYVASLKAKYDITRLREDRLLQALSKQAEVVADAARKSTEYDVLRRELERDQKLYEDLLQKATEVSLSTAMRGSSQIRIVDSAEPPPSPYRPVVAKSVGLGLATGLMLGLGLVFIGERANRRLQKPGETPLYLSVPELAVVPRYDPIARSVAGGANESKPLALMRRLISLGRSQPESAVLVLAEDKPARVAESFQGAVTSILAQRYRRRHSRKLLATSPLKGDGKSTVISNLGITLAEIGYNVVLVDGDIRRPHLNEMFGLPNSWGLTTLATADENNMKTLPLEALVHKTKIDKLSVLTAGPGTSSVSRVLHSKATEDLFERLAAEFDFVLVDSPPALEFSDARLLGRLVDGAIIVVRSGVTTREAAMLVKDRFIEDNLTIIGTILNKWDAKSTHASSYYGYRYLDAAP